MSVDPLAELRKANVARQAEWDLGKQITLSYRGNELAGEVGEACNVIKKLERERLGISGSRDSVDHLAQELADVIICVDLIAAAVGIDLPSAIREKFNATSDKLGLDTRMPCASHEWKPQMDDVDLEARTAKRFFWRCAICGAEQEGVVK